MEDTTTPSAKRVRIAEDGRKDQESTPAFLTPPITPATMSGVDGNDAVLTHDNLCGDASGSPNAAAFRTPRGGGQSDNDGRNVNNNVDSGVSPGPMTKDEIRSLMQREAGYDVDSPHNMKKREGYLTWDDYFMAVASLSSQRSKDPTSQVGACIVDQDNRIVGIGYNGFPRGCSDNCLPWASDATSATKSLPVLHTRDPYMCHAEVNAILNKCSKDVAGARMYVARFPCNECAKVIIQSRIQEVVYLEDSPVDDGAYRAARIMFEMAGVTMRKYKASRPSLTLDFGPLVDEAINDDRKEGRQTTMTISDITKSDQAVSDQAKYKELLIKEAKFDPTDSSGKVLKRQNYLSWDTYFMAVSFLSAQRSKDPNTQVGACIVDANKCIIGIGYNGFPRGCSDECLPWSRQAESELHKKYCYVAHAEVNAILNKCSADVCGATIYVALFPCNDCAKVIIQSGIREVVYLNDHYHDTDGCRASRIMFEMAGVATRQYRPEMRSIDVDLTGRGEE